MYRFDLFFAGRPARRRRVGFCASAILLAAFVVSSASVADAQTQMRTQPRQDYYGQDDGYDTLTRGPIHEAFAEPISFDPEPGPRSPVAPPDPISEIPPQYAPAGANVTWIPGYWIWDEEVNDFLWISGIWRNIPPGREWIAGYWIQSQGGYRWIPGFWADNNRSQTVYLPEPPASIENGPNYQTAPSPDHLWVSGSWMWQHQRYAWRPGYWQPGRADWIWVPAHYVWSPRGYVFQEGYWDYDIERRGVIFAPVRFKQHSYRRPQFRYSPSVVIDLRTLTDHLFLRPRSYHYYFGDYFDQRYVNRGYRPWFSAHTSRKVYDPIYVHRRWNHRNDRGWDDRLRSDFNYRRQNVSARPPRAWAQHRASRPVSRRGARPTDRLRTVVGKALSTIVRRKHDPFDFKPIDDRRRDELSGRRDGVQQTRSQRREVESRTDGKPDRRYRTRTRPAHAPGYKSPVRSKPASELDDKYRPPARPTTPEVDKKVQAKRREAPKRKVDRRKDDKKDDQRDNRRDNRREKKRKDRD